MAPKKNWWWGRSASIDLHGCDPELIKSPKAIKEYVRLLIKELKMVKVGPTIVKKFGYGRLKGYSMMQFIETSCVTAHFDEFGQRAFIDVFSCKKYNPKKVAQFSQEYFKAKRVSRHVEERD